MDDVFLNQIFCSPVINKRRQESYWKTWKKLSSCMLKNKLGMALLKKMQKTITNMSKWDLLSSDIGTLNLGLRSSIAARLVESKVIVDMEGSAIKSKRKSHQEWIMKATNWDSIVYLYN